MKISYKVYEDWKDQQILHDEDNWGGRYKTYGEMWSGEGYEIDPDSCARAFVVGCKYSPYQSEFAPILITRRTDSTIWVSNGTCDWRMRVKRDADGNEYAVDSSVPPRWRCVFTYFA